MSNVIQFRSTNTPSYYYRIRTINSKGIVHESETTDAKVAVTASSLERGWIIVVLRPQYPQLACRITSGPDLIIHQYLSDYSDTAKILATVSVAIVEQPHPTNENPH